MSKRTQPRLGRGLSSLIGDAIARPVKVDLMAATAGEATPESLQTNGQSSLRLIAIDRIVPNPFQPRREIDQAGLEQLAQSVRLSGLIQPLVVRPASGRVDQWELVAGERRWRAAGLAGLSAIPALVMELSDQQAAELAIVENVQREDLDPIERGWAFRRLAEEFGIAHSEIAERVGLDRSSVANLVRLTELESQIQELIVRGELSAGHGKALLSVAEGAKRVELAARAVRDHWSVRVLEKAAARAVRGIATDEGSRAGRALAPAGVSALEKQLGEHLATKVRIRTARQGTKGRIEIEFYDLDHFDGLMSKLGFRMES